MKPILVVHGRSNSKIIADLLTLLTEDEEKNVFRCEDFDPDRDTVFEIHNADMEESVTFNAIEFCDYMITILQGRQEDAENEAGL